MVGCLSGLQKTQRQLWAVLWKNCRVELRHKIRLGCEVTFPLLITGALSFGFLIGGDPLLEVVRGPLTTTDYPEIVLPSVSQRGQCNGVPLAESLAVTEPPYDDASVPPCFEYLDGRAVAIQCRCRTLRVVGPQSVRESFQTFLEEAGVPGLIRNFSEGWRAERPATCPDRPEVELSAADDRDVGDELCAVVSFASGSDVLVKVDATADANIYRPTRTVRSILETLFDTDNCDDLPYTASEGCEILYDMYQRHAISNLQYLAGLFLAQQSSSQQLSNGALSGLQPSTPATVMNLPLAPRTEESRDSAILANILSWLAFLISFPFILWVFLLVSSIVVERERRQKEGMRVMGLQNTWFYLSWVLWVFARAVLVGLLMALISLTWPVSGTGFVLFWWVIVSGIMYTFAYSCVFSTLFSNERTGAMIAAMVFFLVTIPALVQQLQDLPIVIGALMLFPSYWIVQGIKHVIYAEAAGWIDNLTLEGFTVGQVVLLGNAFGIIWYLLYLYLEQVVQQTVGQSLSPFFPCMPAFWRDLFGIAEKEETQEQAEDEMDMETAPREHKQLLRTSSKVQAVEASDLKAQLDSGRAVEVAGLEVYFTGINGEEIRAVDGLSLVMYPGEIFVLLGHNGAGKTTTIGVLSGLVKPTGGAVTIFGKRVPQQLQQVRNSLGLCPQHNVLWEDLTCIEHMDFFLALRNASGTSPKERHALALELLQEVGLGPRAQYKSSELSGGMKRKLSVAIAFNGNPEFVILDEPTSGMDPFSRRVLWDFVKHRRAGRVVLLTTHFMDEADVLGDRIAIMAHGQLQAYGDPQFLKRRFGAGYVVTIVMAEQSVSRARAQEKLQAAIKDVIEGRKGIDLTVTGKEILVQVPFESASCLGELLRMLESKRAPPPGIAPAEQEETEEALVASYGVGVSSLEEVFLKIANGSVDRTEEEATPVEELQPQQPPSTIEGSPTEAAVPAAVPGVAWEEPPNREEEKESGGFGLTALPVSGQFYNQSRALILRRARSAARDRRTFCLVCLVAPTTLLVGCALLYVLLLVIANTTEVSVERVVPSVDSSRVLWGSLAGNPFPGVPAGQTISFSEADLLGVDLNATYDPRPNGEEEEIADVFELFVRPSNPSQILAPASYCSSQGLAAGPCADRWRQHVVLFAKRTLETSSTWDAAVLSIDGHPAVWAREKQFVHSVPMALNALLDKAAGSSMTVSTAITAKEPSSEQRGVTLSAEDTFRYVMPVILVSIAFAFLPTGIMQFIMAEKVVGAKSQLLISGCTYNAYWITNLAWDCLFGILPVLVGVIFFLVFDFEHLVEEIGIVILLMVLFVPGACGLAYVCSQLVSSEAMGTTAMLALNGLIGTLLMLCVMIGDLLTALLTLQYVQEDAATLEQKLADDTLILVAGYMHDIGLALGMLLPGFSLAAGLFRISLRHMFVRKILPPLFNAGQLTDALDTAATGVGGSITGGVLGGTGLGGDIFDTAQDSFNDALQGIIDGIRDLTPTGDDLGDFLENSVLPPLTLAKSFQACYLGTTEGPSFTAGGYTFGPLALQVPCNFISNADGSPQTETSIGSIVDQIIGIFLVGDSLVHIAVLAVVWPILAILVENMMQSPWLSQHFVSKEEVPRHLAEQSQDPDVAEEAARVAKLKSDKQIICVRNLRKAYKSPNNSIVSAVVLALLVEVGLLIGYRQTFYVILAVNLPIAIVLVLLSRWWAPYVYWRAPPATHAVRGVSWASDTGMVFGLLGVNGAGKTTTFEMMSGLRTPSAGEVNIVGLDVVTHIESCRRYIGYCPQFDCIIPFLTPEDHLYLFGRIKGLDAEELEAAVEQKLKEMQLMQYRERRSGSLSGGNKRKLSVAIALIGEPPIVFLDEPSTGMDPFARRFMWKVIDDVAERRQKSVVVLTTHSMEEGEALCSKMAIQVDGRLKCFGSVQQIKSRYGTGYEVPVKFKAVTDVQRESEMAEMTVSGLQGDADDVIRLEQLHAVHHRGNISSELEQKLQRASGDGAPFSQGTTEVPFRVFADWWVLDKLVSRVGGFLTTTSETSQVTVLEHHGLSARFRLPELVDSAKLGVIFESLMAESSLHLDDFSICQSSLEQIFNNFARSAGETAAGR